MAAKSDSSQQVTVAFQARIQAERIQEPTSPLSQIRKGPSLQIEEKNLAEKLKGGAANQQNLALPWIQKAESAMISGRYITPPDDNVLLYCNQALAVDPQNQRALALKKEIIGRSIAQARDWIERRKFEKASLYYSLLNYFSQHDERFPISRQEIQQELAKLEFSSYPVVHQHRLGSCKGRLRVNGYAVSYVPADDSVDGFTERLVDINLIEAEDDVKLKVKGKNYRFRLNSGQGQGSEAAQKSAKPLSDQLTKLLSPRG
jgi:hypothetical protein